MKDRLLICVMVIFFLPGASYSQIEVNNQGNTSIGAEPVNNDRKMQVFFDWLDDDASALYASFNGVGNVDAHGVFARSEPAGGFGIGGAFYGGKYGLTARALLDTDTGVRRGLDTRSNGGLDNWGIYAWALGNNGSRHNYGIMAGVNANGTGNNYAGYFIGDVFVTGEVTDNPSDERLKENTRDLENSLDIINALRPISFTYRREDPEFRGLNLPRGRRYGLVAQEVELVVPELISNQSSIIYNAEVKVDENGDPYVEEKVEEGKEVTFKSIRYSQLIPLLLHAIQEQQTRLDALEALLDANNNR